MENFTGKPDKVASVKEKQLIGSRDVQGEAEIKERPEEFRISLDRYNIDMHRRYLGFTSGEQWLDIYLVAQKRWENDQGFEYAVGACRDREYSDPQTG